MTEKGNKEFIIEANAAIRKHKRSNVSDDQKKKQIFDSLENILTTYID